MKFLYTEADRESVAHLRIVQYDSNRHLSTVVATDLSTLDKRDWVREIEAILCDRPPDEYRARITVGGDVVFDKYIRTEAS